MDVNNHAVPKDENGNYIVHANTLYKIMIVISSPNGFTADIYQYQLPDGGINPEGMEIMRNKIRTIYRIAASTGHDSIVLGAFGCGAFRLPCATVASIFKEVLQEEEFNGQFKAIRFAILDKDGPNGKFAPFYEMFNPNSV